MRRILIVGNWKMHLNASQASLLVHRLQERIKIHPEYRGCIGTQHAHAPASKRAD